jgi:phosphatidylglycerol:prolipoprotein diacylglycerol transferase
MLAIPFPDIDPEIFFRDRRLRLRAALVRDGLYRGHPDRLAHGGAAVRRPALWPGAKPPMTPAQVEDLLTWVILGSSSAGGWASCCSISRLLPQNPARSR